MLLTLALVALAAVVAIPLTQFLFLRMLWQVVGLVLEHMAESERVGGEPRVVVEKRIDLAAKDMEHKTARLRALREAQDLAGPIDPHVS